MQPGRGRDVAKRRGHYETQFFTARYVLDDTRNVINTHIAEGIGTIAPIIKDKTILCIHRLEIVGAEAHS